MSKAVQSRATFAAARRPRQFLREVRLELRKVKWPTPQDVWQMTVVVVLTIVAVGLYVALLDFLFGKLFQLIGMYQ